MGALPPTTWVPALLQLLPGPLLRALDRRSHRRAVARQLQRQQAWMSFKAQPLAELPTQYTLRP